VTLTSFPAACNSEAMAIRLAVAVVMCLCLNCVYYKGSEVPPTMGSVPPCEAAHLKCHLPVAGENVTVLLIIVIGKLVPSCIPVNTNKGRNVHAVETSRELFCKLSARHFALVSVFKVLQFFLTVEFNECLNCIGVVVFQQFGQNVLLDRIFFLKFFFLNCCGSDTTGVHNCFVKCSECGFAILPNVTAGEALFGS